MAVEPKKQEHTVDLFLRELKFRMNLQTSKRNSISRFEAPQKKKNVDAIGSIGIAIDACQMDPTGICRKMRTTFHYHPKLKICEFHCTVLQFMHPRHQYLKPRPIIHHAFDIFCTHGNHFSLIGY
mmetsp:Transcript_21123/g.58758  ORF Transcript_21123/g.58758 Transcript_21123/m.58758 type:complete len:125 (-) Transcript_21123:2129-2503(-)